MQNKGSFIVVLLMCCLLTAVSFLYYPKWQQKHTEATISWDVSGYYLYLPALFIYKDLKKCAFFPPLIEKYKPSSDFQQAFKHKESGNYVMKYSLGQAVQYSPFFAIAHLYASTSPKYEADGFSFPYQLMISIGSLLVAFLGLFYLRKSLLFYFEDGIVAATIVCIVLGSNYLDYTAINGAMTHNNLFTIYCLLLYNTIRFYQKMSWERAIIIGTLIGLAALTRPTEIISCLIPILWGTNLLSKAAIKERLSLLWTHSSKMIIAIVVCLLIGSLQLIYWKYATGDWIVYSYENQGFTWLRPHLYNGFLSYRSGWLVYSPMMLFSLLGFIPLMKNKRIIGATCLFFAALFIYITFAWDIWWYGGSLGQRAMVQAYPILAFPFAAFIQWIVQRLTWQKYCFVGVCTLFIYYNFWLTHQAHRGGLLRPGMMTGAYFWKILLRYDYQEEHQKLLDTNELFEGEPKEIKTIYWNDFEQDTSLTNCGKAPIQGQRSLCLSASIQDSSIYYVKKLPKNAEWIRASANFRYEQKEWDVWRMAQFRVYFYKGDKRIKKKIMRIYRFLHDNQPHRLHFDVKYPKSDFDKLGIQFLNMKGNKTLLIDELKVEVFKD